MRRPGTGDDGSALGLVGVPARWEIRAGGLIRAWMGSGRWERRAGGQLDAWVLQTYCGVRCTHNIM